MASLAQGIVAGNMPWGLLVIGIAFGLALICSGARAPMLIAVGMYLPFDTSSAIALGGIIRHVVNIRTRGLREEDKLRVDDRGSFLASGLIAGEAIMGILLAVTFLAGISSFTRLFTGSDTFGFIDPFGGWTSLLGYAAVAWILISVPLRTNRR
jgi:uncharacterized oligopeptide transporter (OPT) family protein